MEIATKKDRASVKQKGTNDPLSRKPFNVRCKGNQCNF